jgi:hypothetical protein
MHVMNFARNRTWIFRFHSPRTPDDACMIEAWSNATGTRRWSLISIDHFCASDVHRVLVPSLSISPLCLVCEMKDGSVHMVRADTGECSSPIDRSESRPSFGLWHHLILRSNYFTNLESLILHPSAYFDFRPLHASAPASSSASSSSTHIPLPLHHTSSPVQFLPTTEILAMSTGLLILNAVDAWAASSTVVLDLKLFAETTKHKPA